MSAKFLHTYFDAGEIDTPSGRAIVEERYFALRRQVPIIYLLAIVNLSGLELATGGQLRFGYNLPTALIICALARMAQWLSAGKKVSHAVMLRRLRQTCLVAAALCLSVCAWCLHLLQTADPAARMAIILFGGFTGIGAAYGLSSLPSAARIPLLVIALPLSGMALLSNDPQFVGAALSLTVVTFLILRLLSLHNAHFTDVIRSRSIIAEQQELTESARQEALAAATTDFLTGLPNRRAFVAAIEAEVARTNGRKPIAVAVVDLDRFKAINDTFGHGSGDKLLETVAARLSRAANQKALVARLGGDEFGLLFPNVANAAAAKSTGTRILAEVNRPATINGRQFAVSACCGFGLSRGSAQTPSRILADADLALYAAKREAAGGVAVFEPHMEAPHRRRAQIERALQLPDVHENLRLVFQPILDLHTGRPVAYEALARWKDDELGDVSPAEFVPIAEQLNVIADISDRLMEMAVGAAVQWGGDVRLSFNLSAVQLCSAGSAETILALLRELELPPERLQVEVTETTLLADFEKARENLAKLRVAGVLIVLDDFGAGYASIGYLRELRFDQIKLDGMLVTAAEDSAEGERLLGAVIGLCQALGVSTVAEHIETEEQLKLLLRLGCTAGQGYWLQRPVSPDEAREFSHTESLLAERATRISRTAA